jgi:hypothetical protein
MPNLDNMSMSISALNRSMRPRIRSLTRGWVTPRSSAADACFSPRVVITACSFVISSERTLRCSASWAENPRSRNTFPVDRDRRRSAMMHTYVFLRRSLSESALSRGSDLLSAFAGDRLRRHLMPGVGRAKKREE